MTFYFGIIPGKNCSRNIFLSTGDKEIGPASVSCWTMWQIFPNFLFQY